MKERLLAYLWYLLPLVVISSVLYAYLKKESREEIFGYALKWILGLFAFIAGIAAVAIFLQARF